MASRVKHRYVPANTRADLPKGSKNLAMDAFLMSERVADVTRLVTRHIAAEAAALAGVEAFDTGEYASSFEVEETTPIWAGDPKFPRRTMRVINRDEAAAAVELGNSRVGPGKYILTRVGAPYHTPPPFHPPTKSRLGRAL